MHSKARDYLSELHQATCPEESHSSICSPFSPAEFLAAASNLFSSAASGPDKVVCPMLMASSLLCHGFSSSHRQSFLDFAFLSFHLEDIFYYSHTQDGKASRLPSSLSRASFQPISLISCVSKLFECIILSRLLFFLESNSILSPHQAGFCPGRSTLYQIPSRLSQSISNGFNKPRPCS